MEMNCLKPLEEKVASVPQKVKPKYYNKMSTAITKREIENLFNAGMTVKDAAAELTKRYGQKMSEATLRKLCKSAGIDLRKKPRAISVWKLVDEVIYSEELEKQNTPTQPTNDNPINSVEEDFFGL